MRTLFTKERIFINNLLDAKSNSDFEGIETAKLLKDQLSIHVIEWDVDNYSIRIHASTKQLLDNNSYYFDIIDLLALIELLEKEGYIYISKFKPNDQLENILFCRTKYKSVKRRDKYISLVCHDNTETTEFAYDELYTDVAKLFDKYAVSLIFPLNSLIELKNNDYKSIEQCNFEMQLKNEQKRHNQLMNDASIKHIEQMKSANNSFIVALLAVVISVIMPFIIMICSPNTDKQVNVLKTAIESIKAEYSTKIEASLPDTLTIKDIENKRVINNIQ